MSFRFDIIWEYGPFLLSGLLFTMGLTFASTFFGTITGLFIGLGRMMGNKWLASPFTCFITFFRGTPLFVQILIVHFVILPEASAIVAGIVALSLNAGAYIAETFRAGIQSIERGQMEAARSLGMNHFQAMRYIIIPQAVKRILPALGNSFVSLIKDSSLVSVIAAQEVTYWAMAMGAQYYRVWEPYLTLALVYLILTVTTSRLLHRMEKRLATG